MTPHRLVLLLLLASASPACLAWRGGCSANSKSHVSLSRGTALYMSSLQPPPLKDPKRLTLGWKEVAKRAAAGCNAAFKNGQRRVSVDIPQISSVDRSTTARKFEDDNNFMLSMIELMGAKNPTPVGRNIEIKMGGFEGGGDYLSDEGLYGYKWTSKGIGEIIAIGNSEIDCSALRELPKLDDGSSKIILFNVNLDRLSFFDKIGLPKFDNVETAYVLRRVGPGFLSRQYPEDFALWRLDGNAKNKPVLATSQALPFSGQQAETALRNASL